MFDPPPAPSISLFYVLAFHLTTEPLTVSHHATDLFNKNKNVP